MWTSAGRRAQDCRPYLPNPVCVEHLRPLLGPSSHLRVSVAVTSSRTCKDKSTSPCFMPLQYLTWLQAQLCNTEVLKFSLYLSPHSFIHSFLD